jgi:hypothetical protein
LSAHFSLIFHCRRSVGVHEVQLGQLVAALATSPQHCLAELHQLLPCLAASAYSTFINRVRSYRQAACLRLSNVGCVGVVICWDSVFESCLAELHQLLPCLAASAYNTFINRVRSYRQAGQSCNHTLAVLLLSVVGTECLKTAWLSCTSCCPASRRLPTTPSPTECAATGD